MTRKRDKLAASAKARRQVKIVRQDLTARERSRLLKPISNYEEVAQKTAQEWQAVRAKLRVPGLSPGRLLALLRRADRAQARERARASALRLASDARLLADDAAYRALLDVKAFALTTARKHAELRTTFHFLIDALKRGGAKAPPDASSPPTESAGG